MLPIPLQAFVLVAFSCNIPESGAYTLAGPEGQPKQPEGNTAPAETQPGDKQPENTDDRGIADPYKDDKLLEGADAKLKEYETNLATAQTEMSGLYDTMVDQMKAYNVALVDMVKHAKSMMALMKTALEQEANAVEVKTHAVMVPIKVIDKLVEEHRASTDRAVDTEKLAADVKASKEITEAGTNNAGSSEGAESQGFCDNGIIAGDVCCAKSCGETCGGERCHEKDGGSDQCCHNTIKDAGVVCKDASAVACVRGSPKAEENPGSTALTTKS